jgi:large subunit ribosomal protein L7/L12
VFSQRVNGKWKKAKSLNLLVQATNTSLRRIRMADVTRAQVKEFLESMTVLEMAEFTKELEESWGVSAAAPMAIAAMPGGGDGGGAAAEEQTEFNVNLTSIGNAKIQVIKVVREITGLGLKEAKALVDGCPGALKEAVSKEEAEEIKGKIEEVGGAAEIK